MTALSISQSVDKKISILSELGMLAASCKGQVMKNNLRFTNKNCTNSCEKRGFSLSVQIIKQNHTSISIFPAIIYCKHYKLDDWPGA